MLAQILFFGIIVVGIYRIKCKRVAKPDHQQQLFDDDLIYCQKINYHRSF